ncbi:MAG: polysulfide reductase NrfD [Acidimicrobiaceae bacterium]|nr:polysulfide reductase NrfD [Acidimicrobiaceae bacterium]MCY4294519.1 polysulfide reductase NrfD [Acidimicrobiaceae bacterium]
MTRLGFLLDSASCIGCHACTVACKAEHGVALGVNRTWVKYIETGTFPDVGRHFSVMRCNHCDNAPCITICPTNALFRADNGVVDFDDRSCIGCKGCMNACPYDALYINPATNTAHKCNFCNHRIEQNLEPSCVVVCPTHAIKVADLDDPDDATTRLIARNETAVRAPEQRTLPKVHYLGAPQAALDPLRSAIASDGMIWADTTPQHPTPPAASAGLEARTAYTTAHETTWKSRVSSYLVTKAAAAGVMAVAALLALLGHSEAQAAVGVMPAVAAGVLLAVTGALLVGDLRRPGRFYYLLTRPNKRSWLVKGAWVLAAFAVVCGAWFSAAVAGAGAALLLLAAPAIVAGAAVAGYTAFLFNQCEGRDLWQSRLVLPMLLAQGAVAGAAVYLLADPVMDVPDAGVVRWVFLGGLIACGALTCAEFATGGNRHVEAALANLARGRWARRFWVGAIGLGLMVPAIVTVAAVAADGGPTLPAIAAAAAVAGMWFYEDSFVRAGQSVPLS